MRLTRHLVHTETFQPFFLGRPNGGYPPRPRERLPIERGYSRRIPPRFNSRQNVADSAIASEMHDFQSAAFRFRLRSPLSEWKRCSRLVLDSSPRRIRRDVKGKERERQRRARSDKSYVHVYRHIEAEPKGERRRDLACPSLTGRVFVRAKAPASFRNSVSPIETNFTIRQLPPVKDQAHVHGDVHTLGYISDSPVRA